MAEIKVLYVNGSNPLHAELYVRRAGALADGPLRFTPLTITGAGNGWIRDEAARVVRCQLINADLAAD